MCRVELLRVPCQRCFKLLSSTACGCALFYYHEREQAVLLACRPQRQPAIAESVRPAHTGSVSLSPHM